jgi:hypothetical protein
VRLSDKLHDRFLFVDRSALLHLRGVFKRWREERARAVLTQIGDALPAMLDTYEKLWTAAKVER